MKMLNKTKKGFTLIEMVLVIAVISILCIVLVFQISNYLGKAKSATSSVDSHNDAVTEIVGVIEENT
ncbi:MAG: type II secretion system protein [Clostridiales bacterium]|nr:type II secretion system protein [Clostridiales bacterium]